MEIFYSVRIMTYAIDQQANNVIEFSEFEFFASRFGELRVRSDRRLGRDSECGTESFTVVPPEVEGRLHRGFVGVVPCRNRDGT